MKKVLMLSALLAFSGALLVSCQKNNEMDPSAADEPVKTSHILKCVIADDPVSKVDIDSDGNTIWKPGDKILVHAGSGGNKCVVVTLDESDITDAGKTATIDVGELAPYVHKTTVDDVKYQDYESTYYAIYPASAAKKDAEGDNGYKTMYYNTWVEDLSKPVMGGYDDGNGTMIFRNLCAVIQFKVSGSFDRFSFSSNSGSEISYFPEAQWRLALPRTGATYSEVGEEMLQFKPTSDGASCTLASTVTGTVVADGTTTNYICLTGKGSGMTASLPSGFTLNFYNSASGTPEAVVKILSTKTGFTLARNDFLDLGDISEKLYEPHVPSSTVVASGLTTDVIDLSTANGPANCYVPTAAGQNYKFPVVKGNDAGQSAGYVYSVELLWETCNTNVAPTLNSVIADLGFDGPSNYVYFKTPSPLKAGNALIAAKDNKGKIIWSWHIWIPEDTIDGTKNYGIYDHNMMDRNLGALVAAVVDEVAPVESFGLMYQWGRKDPFMGPETNSSSTPAAVCGTTPTVNSGKISLTESLRNPTVMAWSAGGQDWITSTDNILWKDEGKTIYDPCPPGYRVPARSKTQPMHDATDISTKTTYEYNTTNKYFTLGNVPAVFPIAGRYDDYAGDSWPRVDYVNSQALLWTAHYNSDNTAYIMDIRSDRRKLSNRGKCALGSIRCVAE